MAQPKCRYSSNLSAEVRYGGEALAQSMREGAQPSEGRAKAQLPAPLNSIISHNVYYVKLCIRYP